MAGQNGGLAKANSGCERRQFRLVYPHRIDLVGRPAAEDRVGSIGVILGKPTTDPGSYLTAGLEGIEVDAFVFQRSPQRCHLGFEL